MNERVAAKIFKRPENGWKKTTVLTHSGNSRGVIVSMVDEQNTQTQGFPEAWKGDTWAFGTLIEQTTKDVVTLYNIPQNVAHVVVNMPGPA